MLLSIKVIRSTTLTSDTNLLALVVTETKIKTKKRFNVKNVLHAISSKRLEYSIVKYVMPASQYMTITAHGSEHALAREITSTLFLIVGPQNCMLSFAWF